MDIQRQSGILLHPTSLPEFSQIGCLGKHAYRYIDFLHDCGQQVWQMLPIGPTHGDGSPYQPLSAYAANRSFIDVDDLYESGWLSKADTKKISSQSLALDLAFDRFYAELGGEEEKTFRLFVEEEKSWLVDYALFCVARDIHDGKSWLNWSDPIRDHEAAALIELAAQHKRKIDAVYFEQYVFAKQWRKLKAYAKEKHVKLFGDMPIFVALDSAEVWAQRQYFDVDEAGSPRFVAGVPPDYFSETGQRWGNPHYNWQAMQEDGFQWWLRRCQHELKHFDFLRIDHFRGFEAYWKIPVECETAIDGFWEKAPGAELFSVLCEQFPNKPFVAEDLGVITDEVVALRKQFDLPGMGVLQFAFDGKSENPHLPANYDVLTVAYTGTHDNDTSLGWLQSLDEETKTHLSKHIDMTRRDMPWPMIKMVMESRAFTTIIPLQDVMMLDGEHRMNTPGTTEGNWQWSFAWEMLPKTLCAKLLHATRHSGRLGTNEKVSDQADVASIPIS